MEQKIVLTGIARSKGKAAGEAAVNRQRMGWAFNHVGNEDGIVLVPGADLQGKSIIGKVVVYPTVMGSTTGAPREPIAVATDASARSCVTNPIAPRSTRPRAPLRSSWNDSNTPS